MNNGNLLFGIINNNMNEWYDIVLQLNTYISFN